MTAEQLLVQKGMNPQLAPYAGWLLDVLTYNGIRYSVNSVYRSHAEQQALYDRYLQGINKYPVARPGTSLHERGLAMDINSYPDVNEQLGAIWNRMGGRWNGADKVHYGV